MAKRWIVAAVLCVAAASAWSQVIWDSRIFNRGDANGDFVVDSADAVCINAYLFLGGKAPQCLNQADANDDGAVNVSDSTYILNWLFLGGPAPPAPGPHGTRCTEDGFPYPGCETDPCP